MVVKHRGHAVFDAVGIDGIGGQTVVFVREVPVDLPPLALENVVEILRTVPVDGQAACEGAVDMVVHVDEARHDHAAPRVDGFRIRVFSPERGAVADLHNSLTVDDDRAIFIKRAVVTGNQPAVSDPKHRTISPFNCCRCMKYRVLDCRLTRDFVFPTYYTMPQAKRAIERIGLLKNIQSNKKYFVLQQQNRAVHF